MEILILTNKMPYPPTDGGSIATLAMIKEFRDQGVGVTVLAMNTFKHNFDPENLPENLKENIEWHACYVDTRIKAPELLINLIFSQLPYNAKRFISKTYKTRLKQILLAKRFDIVQLEGLYLYPYISTIRKYSDALVAFRAHNIEQEIWKRTVRNSSPSLQRVYSRIISLRMQRMEKRSLKKFDLLVPITERDAHIFDFLGNQAPYYVAPVGINPSEFDISPTIAPKSRSLFFIGSLDWMPNREGLIWFINRVWGRVLETCPDAEFHIAGRNAPKDFIHQINRKNITFHGQVDDAKIFASNHNIMVVPLLTGSGMRVKIIEGMALGKPIVATMVAAEGIQVENHQDIILALDEREFAEGVIQLLTSPIDCSRIGQNARQKVMNQYDNRKIVSGLINFYQTNLSRVQ